MLDAFNEFSIPLLCATIICVVALLTGHVAFAIAAGMIVVALIIIICIGSLMS